MATFFQEDDIIGKAYDARIVRRLLTYVRPYMRLAVIALILLFIVSLLDLVGPALTGYGIDHYVAPNNLHMSAAERGYGILWVALAFLAVLLVGLILRYLHLLLLNIVGQHIMFDLRSQMFDE